MLPFFRTGVRLPSPPPSKELKTCLNSRFFLFFGLLVVESGCQNEKGILPRICLFAVSWGDGYNCAKSVCMQMKTNIRERQITSIVIQKTNRSIVDKKECKNIDNVLSDIDITEAYMTDILNVIKNRGYIFITIWKRKRYVFLLITSQSPNGQHVTFILDYLLTGSVQFL